MTSGKEGEFGKLPLKCAPGPNNLHAILIKNILIKRKPMSTRQFSDQERAILKIVQKNLPDSLTPYADIAASVGVSEEEVINLLKRMKEDGSIRRFGASIKHQKAGFAHNAMVAWIVSKENVDSAGEEAARHPMISHCYYRPSTARDWPYEFYTMIHGREPDDYKQVVQALQASTCLEEFAVLESLRELKKTSMTYF